MQMDNNSVVNDIINDISCLGNKKLRIMEVCGTHTQAVSKSGLRNILPENIELVSGPGCPVCVTSESCIDAAIEMINEHNVLLATFGDMLRIRGTMNSISEQVNKRKNIVVVYSPLDCLELASKNPGENVVFFAVGFETTAPGIALAIRLAEDNNINNLSFLTSLKLMPPVLHSILREKRKEINGIICPGHVAAVMGAGYFRFITEEYNIAAAVCGFEALDIALGIHYLSSQNMSGKKPTFSNLYETCVQEVGNTEAHRMMHEVFEFGDASWRGIGFIRESALILRKKYSFFNALQRFGIKLKSDSPNKQCDCRDVLLGNISPSECCLFGKECTPQKPAGPCMVSGEGSCSTYYRYTERGLKNG
jgi:hydrogenase expression/formation protein HypD